MKDLRKALLLLSALLFAVAGLTLFPCHVDAQSTTTFRVFDALLYKGKPDLSQSDLGSIRMIYGSELWNNGESRDMPNSAKLAEVARKIQPDSFVCVDIEHWPVSGKNKEVKESFSKYTKVVSVLRQNAPTAKVGFYGVLPIRDYWRAIGIKGRRGFDEWRRQNSKLMPLAESVDAVFPSLYTFYPDRMVWEDYAMKNLREARKFGKPVYAFLWPQYHDSNSLLKGQYIAADFWRLQLETCRKYADGIVIWGGWQEQWDENAPWWVETKRFMEGLQKGQ